jgi:hypothetical protein
MGECCAVSGVCVLNWPFTIHLPPDTMAHPNQKGIEIIRVPMMKTLVASTHLKEQQLLFQCVSDEDKKGKLYDI